VLAVGLVIDSLSAFVAIGGLLRILEHFSAWPFAVYRAFIGAVLLAALGRSDDGGSFPANVVIPGALIKCPHRAGRRVGFSPLLSYCHPEISWRRLTGHPLGLRIALAFRWRAIVTNPRRDSFNRSVTVHHPHGLHLSILRYFRATKAASASEDSVISSSPAVQWITAKRISCLVPVDQIV
jgi:hypothetical protein